MDIEKTKEILRPFVEFALSCIHLPDREPVAVRVKVNNGQTQRISEENLISLYASDFKALEKWADAQFKAGEGK